MAQYVLPEHAELRKRIKTKLLSQCRVLVGEEAADRKPLNIAVIGPPGCGKSAFLNTVFASLKNDEGACWKEIAKMGNYGGLGIQETKTIRSFNKKIYLEGVNDNTLMPTFLDMTGFEDEDSQLNRELLAIILDGKLKNNETLDSVIEWYKKKGNNINELRYTYYKRPDNLVVDRIIVVCSLDLNRSLPVNLLRVIRETKNRPNRDITVFGVLTHADKFSLHMLNGDRIIQRQREFKRELGLIGSRFKTITNYCEDFDPGISYISTTIPKLDIPILELMTQVLLGSEQKEETMVVTNTSYLSKRRIIFLAVIVLCLAIFLMKR